jgi:mono/diheme cytochrome c family protein
MSYRPTRHPARNIGLSICVLVCSAGVLIGGCEDESTDVQPAAVNTALRHQGQFIFRFDTFGNEVFWSDTLRMHEVVENSVDPMTALAVGLKVDADALPHGILDTADLNDPATTVALLKLDAVVGIKATVDENNHITKLGITCALCHSTVDNSVMPGIGRRKDGWPNRDLDVGKIITLSPNVSAEQKEVYGNWGPGMYDPRYNIDNKNTPLVLPPAYGLKDIENETYTAEGPISYWNAYVAVTQMHGQGNFSDPQLGIDIQHSPDLVTPKLPALRDYQHSLRTPKAPAGTFNAAAAVRGRDVFNEHCESCHVGGRGTDNNDGVLHDPIETGMDGDYAARTTTKQYRTTPLRGLWQHPPYFHDGSATTLADVVAHYNTVLGLTLSPQQRSDLEEYLKTL